MDFCYFVLLSFPCHIGSDGKSSERCGQRGNEMRLWMGFRNHCKNLEFTGSKVGKPLVNYNEIGNLIHICFKRITLVAILRSDCIWRNML